jgi:hypothetical protein
MSIYRLIPMPERTFKSTNGYFEGNPILIYRYIDLLKMALFT